MLEYVQVTPEADTPIDYPELVKELEDLGFIEIGRFVAVPKSGSIEDLADVYEPSLRARFLHHAMTPIPVLRSPDRSTLAEVAWLWDSPSLRMRTCLQDGSLVETLRRWDHPLPVAEAMTGWWKAVDIDQEMLGSNNPRRGRSMVLAARSSPAEQWAEHQRHVARYSKRRSSRPMEHNTLDMWIAISQAALANDVVNTQRAVSLWKPLMYAFAAFFFLVIGALVAVAVQRFFAGDRSGGWIWASALGVALLAAALTMPMTRIVIGRVRTAPRFMRAEFHLDNHRPVDPQ